MQSARVTSTPLYTTSETSSLLPDSSPGMRRTIVAPSFTHRLGDASFFSVSAILAYQRFTGFDLSISNSMLPAQDAPALGPNQPRNKESGFGSGARVDFGHVLNDQWSWQAGYQTRINMDGFNSYQGLYARPGSFDIPASMNVGLGYQIDSSLQADVQVERIMYSGITPLISSDLPPRLINLLGSYWNNSLVWNNLIVRSVGLSWHNASFGNLSMRFSSRQQPLPTSALLQQALLPNISSHSWELSYAHAFGERSTLRVLGIYAPIQLLGQPTATFPLNNANGGNQMRLEALWSTTF